VRWAGLITGPIRACYLLAKSRGYVRIMTGCSRKAGPAAGAREVPCGRLSGILEIDDKTR